jgi:hypothetical protein
MVNNLITYDSGSELKLRKKLYEKSAYLNTINTQFTELVPIVPQTPVEEVVNIGEFFQIYENLFYEIPKEGKTNSHEFLIKQSTDYVGSQGISDEIQALLDEITFLRQENLTLQKNIIDLTADDNTNTTQ